MHKLSSLHWPLIIDLGALALVQPVVSSTGLLQGLGVPSRSMLVPMLISLVWLAVSVFTRIRDPILTLIFTGITYGVFTIVINASLSMLLNGVVSGSHTNPRASISLLLFNAIWGGGVGMLAKVIRRAGGQARRWERN